MIASLLLTAALLPQEPLQWDMVALNSPGGQLTFGIEVTGGPNSKAYIINAGERIEVPRVEYKGRNLVLGFDHYASELRVHRHAGKWTGEWVKRTGAGKETRMEFAAQVRSLGVDLAAEGAQTPTDIGGTWKVYFHGEDGTQSEPAIAKFVQRGPHDLEGTFLTPTGDYRFLDGRFIHKGRHFELSCFDGAHAFLFRAEVISEDRIMGEFWSRDSWHETWTADRVTSDTDLEGHMPSPVSMTSLKPGSKFDFTFPDLDGRRVSLSDARFAGKPLIVEIFGSWCPNCHDAAPVLADLRMRYAKQGLQVLGLAYELTGDPALDAMQVRRYAARHKCDWPILLAGTSSKAGASLTLPSLTGIKSYPTTIFLDRNHEVVEIYTGFSGPATGAAHDKLRAHWDALAQQLVRPQAGSR